MDKSSMVLSCSYQKDYVDSNFEQYLIKFHGLKFLKGIKRNMFVYLGYVILVLVNIPPRNNMFDNILWIDLRIQFLIISHDGHKTM